MDLRKRYRHTVTGTWQQSSTWGFAAAREGLSISRFLARAGDIYAQHLANVQLRRETSAFRRMDRELYEARRR